jgi:hypothetical protein
MTFGFFDATRYQKELVRTEGKVAPEHRLYAPMLGSVLIPIGLLVSAPELGNVTPPLQGLRLIK